MTLNFLVPLFAYSAVKNPDTFIEIKSSGDLDSLDPAWAFDVASLEALMNIYEPLIGYKGTSIKEFEPMLSETVPSLENGMISADGKTYTFPIRKGVRFHDGTPVACEDARYSILRFMISDRPAGPSWLLLEPIAGISGSRDKQSEIILNFKDISSRVACEGNNLKITLPKPFGPFLSVMAQWSYVLSKKWAVSEGEWDGTEKNWKDYNNPKKENSHLFDHTNGTGPFELEKWDKTLKQISFKRFEKYWRAPAKLKRALIKGVPEFTTRKLLIAEGDADFIDETAGRQFEGHFAGLPGVKLMDFPYLRVEALYFTFHVSTAGNNSIGSGKLDGRGIPPDFFTDKDARLAFAHAFDYETFIREVHKGKATRPTGFMPHQMLGYNPQQAVYPYDLKISRQYFKKAWKGKAWDKGFKLACFFDANNTIRQMSCELLKRGLQQVNPKFLMDIRPLQWSTYLADLRAQRMPLFKLGWMADYPDPHNFAFAFLHSQGTYPQRQKFGYPEWDKLVEEARTEPDPKKREKTYFKLQELAYQEVPQIYVEQPLAFRVMRDWVQGFYFNPIHSGVYFYPIWKEEKK